MDTDPDPALFVSGFQDAKKNNFFSMFFCLLHLERAFTSFFKDKKSHKTLKNSTNQGFSYFLCLIMEGSGSVQIMMDLDPGGQKNYGSGPTTLP
jgi:hypothetical protein